MITLGYFKADGSENDLNQFWIRSKQAHKLTGRARLLYEVRYFLRRPSKRVEDLS